MVRSSRPDVAVAAPRTRVRTFFEFDVHESSFLFGLDEAKRGGNWVWPAMMLLVERDTYIHTYVDFLCGAYLRA